MRLMCACTICVDVCVYYMCMCCICICVQRFHQAPTRLMCACIMYAYILYTHVLYTCIYIMCTHIICMHVIMCIYNIYACIIYVYMYAYIIYVHTSYICIYCICAYIIYAHILYMCIHNICIYFMSEYQLKILFFLCKEESSWKRGWQWTRYATVTVDTPSVVVVPITLRGTLHVLECCACTEHWQRIEVTQLCA